MKVEFYHAGGIDDNQLMYVIICPKNNQQQWIFVRHRERVTWEIPSGHIEPDEKPLDAARRELYEETGAINFSILPLFDYSVTIDGNTRYGRVFLANVETIGTLPDFEIAEINISENLPYDLTYPKIQPLIFEKTLMLIHQAEI